MKEPTISTVGIRRIDLLKQFFASHSPPEDAIEHFNSIPWLKAWTCRPNYIPVPTFLRHLKDSGEDYFFSRTINSSRTISHMVTLKKRNLTIPRHGEGFKFNGTRAATGRQQQEEEWKTACEHEPDIAVLVDLGANGLDGHPGVLHGGVVSALLDENMSGVIMLHRLENLTGSIAASLFTANLNISFRGAISTPGQIIVKCWLLGRERRKWWTRGQIVDYEDRVLAQGDALWVEAKQPRI